MDSSDKMIDSDKIIDKIYSLNGDVDTIESILTDTVSYYSADLDRVMDEIQKDIIEDEYPAINTIEKYFLELSNVLYFMCERSERLGVFDSISKSKAQETYNVKYLEHQHSTDGQVGAKKPTIAESQAVSESAALYDKTVNDIYNKAYRIVKNKVDAAETMVSTLSKILSHRMQESQMTGQQLGRRILNEENTF